MIEIKTLIDYLIKMTKEKVTTSIKICKHNHPVCKCSICQDENYARQWSKDETL